MGSPLYFKQIEIGPMQNFVYLVGSTETRKAAVVDAAWDIAEVLRLAEADGMEITHALVTHTHPDHVGGEFAGMRIEGLAELLGRAKAKIVIHKAEAEYLRPLSNADLIKADSGDEIDVGGIKIRMIHTPGHTPGSQCFLAGDRLVSGDTLFIDSCGRVDLPGSDPEQMYFSLTQKLMSLPHDTILFPGHNYAARRTSTMGEQKQNQPIPAIPLFTAVPVGHGLRVNRYESIQFFRNIRGPSRGLRPSRRLPVGGAAKTGGTAQTAGR